MTDENGHRVCFGGASTPDEAMSNDSCPSTRVLKAAARREAKARRRTAEAARAVVRAFDDRWSVRLARLFRKGVSRGRPKRMEISDDR